MSDLLKRIENEALGLSTQECAFLADRLLSSLGGDAFSEIDTAWIAGENGDRFNFYESTVK